MLNRVTGDETLIGFRGRAPVWAAILVLAPGLWAQNLKEFERKVTEFSLANGLHFILVERHESPVVSLRTWVNAGSANDPADQTGLAHMFEHLAYKGTETIGSVDWASEKNAMDAVEEAAEKLQAEQIKGAMAAQDRLDILRIDLNSAVDRAERFSRSGDFPALLESNGAEGLKAAVSYDRSEFYCNLPANRIELWFLMESQRLLAPVFRQFYRERETVLGEDRNNVESNTLALLLREVVTTAYPTGPYHNPTLGWPADIAELRTRQAREFFEKYYVPANMVITVVGDLNPEECRKLADRYFGALPSRPVPPPPHTYDVPQRGPRTVQMEFAAQPLLAYGFRRPAATSPDDPVFTVISQILTGGRTGLLYKELVEGQRLAQQTQGVAAYPASRYPCLFSFLLIPTREHTAQEVQNAADAVLDSFAAQRIDDETLSRARRMSRAAMVKQMETNAGLAALLPAYYTTYGDWRKLFTSLGDLDKVTAEDVQRVARRYLVASQRTVGFTTTPASAPAARGGR